MKRTLVFIVFALVIITANAQVGFGVRAGYGYSKVTSNNVLEDCGFSYKGITGPTVGMMMDYQVNSLLGIQAELNYSLRGYKDNVGIMDGDVGIVSYKIKSSYIELPVIAKFYPLKQVGFNIQAGPQIGVLLDRSVSLNSDELTFEDLKGKDSNIDYGLTIGIGENYKQWCLDLRYYLGLSKTYTDIDGHRNRGFFLSIGYYFN